MAKTKKSAAPKKAAPAKKKAPAKSKKPAPKKVAKKAIVKKAVVKKKTAPVKKKVVQAKKSAKKPIAKKVSKPVKKVAPAKPQKKQAVVKAPPVKIQPAPKKVAPVAIVKPSNPISVPLSKPTSNPIHRPIHKETSATKPVLARRRPSRSRSKPSGPPSAANSKEKGKKPEVPVKKKKVTLQSILDQPKPPIFVKKAELPKINYPPAPAGKKQFRLEFEMRSSPKLLFNYLSTASGLAAWFANDVNIRDGQYTFFWNGSSARAKVLVSREEMLIAFQWMDEPDGSYFIFEINQDDITGDVALIVSDFALPSEIEQNRMLWNSQIAALAQVIGS